MRIRFLQLCMDFEQADQDQNTEQETTKRERGGNGFQVRSIRI